MDSNFQRDILALVIRHFCFDLSSEGVGEEGGGLNTSSSPGEVHGHHAPAASSASSGSSAAHGADGPSDHGPSTTSVTTGSLSDFLCAKADSVKIATFDDASPRSDSGLAPQQGALVVGDAPGETVAAAGTPPEVWPSTAMGAGAGAGVSSSETGLSSETEPPVPPRTRAGSRPEVIVDPEVPPAIAAGMPTAACSRVLAR